jgi:tetratricopeptide (TPR) repeat protein
MALPLIFIFVLVDYYQDRNLFTRKVLLEKIPFLLIVILFGWISIVAQKATWGADLSQEQQSLLYRILFPGYAFLSYIFKLIFPYKLSGFYPYPKEISDLTAAFYGFLVLISLAMIIIAFKLRRKFVILFFGFFFYSLNIFPLLKIVEVPAGDYIMADRYSYVASIGIFLIVASAYHKLIKISPLYKKIGIGILTTYLLFISLHTFNRLTVWQNDISFYTDIINKYPEDELAYTNRGSLLKENHKYQKALHDFNTVIQLGKKDYKTFANRGAVYSDLGQYNKAVQDYEKAVQLKSDQPDILASYGFVLLKTGQYQRSIDILTRSLQFRENNPEAYTNRGTAWFSLGRFDKAIEDYLVATKYDPAYIQAHFNRGLSRINSGEPEDAIADFLTVLKINPNHYESYSNMGVAWSKRGKTEKAFECYDKAIKINPNYYEAWLNRGVDKYYQNNFEGALIDLTRSLEINPNLAPAYYFRGMILLETDRQASCNDMNKAVSLGFSAAISFVNNYCK